MAACGAGSYQWSEYWKYKDRDTDEDAEIIVEEMEEVILEEFQFQLRVQAEWEMTELDSKGRLSTYHRICHNFQHEYDSEDWNEKEMKS